jgi:hypothetical protein
MGQNSPTGPVWRCFSPLCAARIAAQRISTVWCTPSRPVPHSRGKAQHYLASRAGLCSTWPHRPTLPPSSPWCRTAGRARWRHCREGFSPRLSLAKVDRFSCESKQKSGRLSPHLSWGLGGGVPINIAPSASDFPQEWNLNPSCHPSCRHAGARSSMQNWTCRELRDVASRLFDKATALADPWSLLSMPPKPWGRTSSSRALLRPHRRPKTHQVGPLSCVVHVGRKTLEISAPWRSGAISDELHLLWRHRPPVFATVAS